MAKKDENKKAESELSELTSAKATETETEVAEAEKIDETTEKSLQGEAVKCVALLITLRASHPHDSYGRCGYRFNKETPVRIPIADIPSEAIGVFDNDPYLDCEYECE